MNRAKYSQSSFTAEPKSAGGDSVCGAPAGRAGNYPALHPGAFPALRGQGGRGPAVGGQEHRFPEIQSQDYTMLPLLHT